MMDKEKLRDVDEALGGISGLIGQDFSDLIHGREHCDEDLRGALSDLDDACENAIERCQELLEHEPSAREVAEVRVDREEHDPDSPYARP